MELEKYQKMVFKMLDDLKENDFFEVIKNVAPENREKFTDVVKDYIDNQPFNKQHFTQIEFNNSYTKIRRI